MKTCTKCKESKELTAFNKKTSCDDGLDYVCRQCNQTACQHYNSLNKYGRRLYSLKKLYGLTEKDYNDLLVSQNFVCAICLQKETNKDGYLHVDHCHDTEKVRGLLCNNCNRALGLFKDSSKILQRATEYLNA